MAWEPPMAGWVKLNVDGSRDNQTGSIAVGRVARDLNSNWVRGFAMHLRAGNILEAELNAVLLGLDMVWDAGFRKVIVESDCLEAITLIQNDCSINNPLWWLIQKCKKAVSKEWSCHLAHIYRECNGAADALAGMGHVCSNSICFFDTTPLSISHIVKRDAGGLIHARFLAV
ncbi:hypothetical protein ACOSP7_019397 [Xanthoceras sorbifolium]